MQRIKYAMFSAAVLAGGFLTMGCTWGQWYTNNGWPRAIALWLNEELLG
jgi:hypothetical protein